MKNRISELERQIIEKYAVIDFLSNQLVNRNLNGDSRVNKTVNDHNNSFQERVDNIVNNNLPLVQHNDYSNPSNKLLGVTFFIVKMQNICNLIG